MAFAPPFIRTFTSLNTRRAVYDTFTDTNGTAIASHAPDIAPSGAAWANTDGTITIQSNTFNPATFTSSVAQARIESGVANGKINLRVKFGTTPGGGGAVFGIGCVFRYTDSSNFWQVRANQNSSLLELFEHNGGVATQRAFISKTFSNNTDYEMSVTFNGSSIVATIDGGSMISYNSAAHNQTATIVAGRIVMSGTLSATPPRLDNFEVVG